MIDRKKYDVYNKYNTDNKHAGEVMHYNKDSEKLYISLFYPKTESEKLNTIINDYYKEYLDNQKASKNSKDILYMDY
ncbi:MAG TPA: polysaccharide deacetylase, partial [[Clostridium] spiroforme]|nr:polysaccharide deacetylase [Thomasclavelia spiroformis]